MRQNRVSPEFWGTLGVPQALPSGLVSPDSRLSAPTSCRTVTVYDTIKVKKAARLMESS